MLGGKTPTIAKYIAETSAKDPKGVAKAVDQLLEAGLTMDPALVKVAVQAHEKALKSAAGAKGLATSQADFAAVNEALARMIGSADKTKFYALLTAFPGNSELQQQLFKENDASQAQAAYKAFVELTGAVGAASTNGANPFPAAAVTGGKVGDAAAKFTDASYPLISKIDWGNTPIISSYIQTAAAKNPRGIADAFGKTLAVGASMDPNLVGAAVAAHDKALDNAIDNPGLVASKADVTAVVDALARMIGSADPGKFKGLLTAFPGNGDLQMGLFAAGATPEAKAAYQAFVELTTAVKR